MNEKNSLKKDILKFLILFSSSVILIFGIISFINFYNLKLDNKKYNQNLVLKQVEKEVTNLIKDIEMISKYLNKYGHSKIVLRDVVNLDKNISSIMILDEKGLLENFYIKNNLNKIYKGFDFSNKNYYKELNNKQDYWSNVFLSTFNSEPAITYSFKFRNKIAVISISLSKVANYISGFKNYDNSFMIKIFDKNGVIIINPNNEDLVSQRYNAKSSEVFTKLINKNKTYVHASYLSENNIDKELGAYVNIKKTNWYIVVRDDYKKLLILIVTVLLILVFIILIFMIISIYFSLQISKKIFKSFDNFHHVTSNISNGKYEVEEKELYYDEFHILLNYFNKMKTEIDKREENLENSLYSFKSLFNSTMESIILHQDKICIDVNDVTLKLFNAKSKDEIIGKNIFTLIAPSFRKVAESKYHEDASPYELELLKMDGTKIQALVQGKYLNLNNKRIKVSALIDITELKNKDHLLFQQSKMASMGEMLGNIAHQWRQPLSIISTYASGIKLEKEFDILNDDKLTGSMDMIVHQTQYLSRTIDDFRNFFKLEKHAEFFIVRESIENSLKLLSANLKSNNITLKINFLSEDFTYEGYPNEFVQVIINIINNSKDAFLANNIDERCIEINESYVSENYVLTIEDNGGGIQSSIIDKVFDPYFTTKHKSQGTGIGLYMSHQIIVDHMNGSIKVKNIDYEFNNKIYKGTCFKIELPKNIEDN
ncbi:MAG: PAS domain S-box protein [Arcobacter sp.]|nr:PAS domain S-box protein [Arcobacter sp.]